MILKIAHRGASGTYPENTMLAFRQALELGANALELDVFMCQSGEPVVIHDPTLERTTSGKGRVNAHTLEALKSFYAGRGEKIPSLYEALDAFAQNTIIFIEIKELAASQSVAKLISNFVKKGVPYSHMPVIGFDKSWLLAARAVDPNILIGYTTEKATLDDCDYAKSLGAWSINPCIDHLNETFVKHAHALGLTVITWTANTPEQINKAKMHKVDGIISDFPERL